MQSIKIKDISKSFPGVKANSNISFDINEGSILGDPNNEINSICGIENGNEKSLSYIKDKRFLKFHQETKSSIVIIDENAEITSQPDKTFIKVKDPQYTFSKILKLFSDFEKIEAQNYISKNNFIANPGKISTKSYIGKDCIIEKNVQIFPNFFKIIITIIHIHNEKS